VTERDDFTGAAGNIGPILWGLTIVCVASMSVACNAQPAKSNAAPTGPEAAAQSQPDKGSSVGPQTKVTSASSASLSGKELFARHCAACHGEKGDGQGIAARFLFPKPRDFRAGRFRLVSTANGVPTADDFNAVLLRGMPGSAMPPWAHLSEQDRAALVEELLRIRRDAVRELAIQQAKDDGEEIDEAEIAKSVRIKTTPGKVAVPPKTGEPDAVAVARGKELYIKQGCASCHGNEGRGDGQQKMVDNEGLPTRPRDFLRGIFKGSPDQLSLYRRILIGMPGTPMPSSNNLKPEQIADMVAFVRSLSDEKAREAAVLTRAKIVAHGVAAAPTGSEAAEWSAISPVKVRTVPLWWRDDAEPDLEVQAVHDGKTLALRLRWRAAAPNHATRTEAFKDAVAVELFRGPVEPFIGMGGPGAPVDIWMWDADRQDRPEIVENAYPRTVVDIYPFHEKDVGTAEFSRPGARLVNQPPVSLPAVEAGNQIAAAKGEPSGGSTLAASGPGSLTFRVPKNQSVNAMGQWKDGFWTVVMSRALVGTEGVAFAPGDKASIALAVWDGARHDRNGQKLVSIWQDLEFEPARH
jgi:mono/diheme cytochrome c family protein